MLRNNGHNESARLHGSHGGVASTPIAYQRSNSRVQHSGAVRLKRLAWLLAPYVTYVLVAGCGVDGGAQHDVEQSRPEDVATILAEWVPPLPVCEGGPAKYDVRIRVGRIDMQRDGFSTQEEWSSPDGSRRCLIDMDCHNASEIRSWRAFVFVSIALRQMASENGRRDGWVYVDADIRYEDVDGAKIAMLLQKPVKIDDGMEVVTDGLSLTITRREVR